MLLQLNLRTKAVPKAIELFSVKVVIPSLDLLFWCSKIHFASSALHIDAFELYSVWLCSYTDDANVYFH